MTTKYKINSSFYFSTQEATQTVRCVNVESTDMVIFEFEDEVAHLLVKSLSEERSFDELCRIIEEEFEVEGDEYKDDIRDFLKDLSSKGILDQTG